MASTFHNTGLFFCIFPMNFAMATLGLKVMGKFLWGVYMGGVYIIVLHQEFQTEKQMRRLIFYKREMCQEGSRTFNQ